LPSWSPPSFSLIITSEHASATEREANEDNDSVQTSSELLEARGRFESWGVHVLVDPEGWSLAHEGTEGQALDGRSASNMSGGVSAG